MSSSKNILVTGATSGIGKETAIQLKKLGHSVHILGRNRAMVQQTLEMLNGLSGATSKGFVADLSNKKAIIEVAEEIKKTFTQLDVLINNAGAYFTHQELNEDGIEKTWATNHLSYFLLTHELFPLLEKSASARIVNVASHSHYGGKLHVDDLNLSKKWDGYKAYEQSKLGNVLFTMELAKRLGHRKITVNALHPGVVKTDIARKNASSFVSFFWTLVKNTIAIPVAKGAATSVFLAHSQEVDGQTGKYWDKSKHKWQSRYSQTPGLTEKCWEISVKQTGADWKFL